MIEKKLNFQKSTEEKTKVEYENGYYWAKGPQPKACWEACLISLDEEKNEQIVEFCGETMQYGLRACSKQG